MEQYFNSAYDVDDYKWKDKKNKDFIHRFISILLTLDTEFNPNHYISELSGERQDIILEIGNYLYNNYEINNINNNNNNESYKNINNMITTINEFKKYYLDDDYEKITYPLVSFLDKHVFNNDELNDLEYVASKISNYAENQDIIFTDDEKINLAKQYNNIKNKDSN